MSTILRLMKPQQVSYTFRRLSNTLHRRYPKYLLNNVNFQCRHFASFQDVHVPNLGDSISEGTIVNIYKKVGDRVEQDEVVLEIETDKVTVDVRAPDGGYIAKLYEAVENDVEVGSALYSLSDEPIDPSQIPTNLEPPSKKTVQLVETSTSSDSSAAGSAPTPAAKAAAAPTPTPVAQDGAHRIPSIKFLHGDRAAIDAIVFGSSSPLTTGVMNGSATGPAVTYEFFELPKELQRTAWTEEEIDAVNLGGAESVLSRIK